MSGLIFGGVVLLQTIALLMAQTHCDSSLRCTEFPETLCTENEGPTSGNKQQLVLYKPPQFLQPLQEKEKRVKFAGHEWIIQQNWDSVGVAAVVWEPALALCDYLESVGPELLAGKRVIELGAGTGLVGLVSHALGAGSVVITDRNPVPAQQNLKLNSDHLHHLHRPVTVRELTWGQDLVSFQPPYDLVLAADVVYIEESFPALIQTMWDLSDSKTTLMLACKYRYERDTRFLEMLRERFGSEMVWTSGDLSIHRLRKEQ